MYNLALIGHNISYSLSPTIYNYWFSKYKIKAKYSLIDINHINLLNNYNLNNYLGFNITTPYKNDIVTYLQNNKFKNFVFGNNYVNTASCNFVKFNNNQVFINNTDVTGLLNCFSAYKLNLSNKNIVILGFAGVTPSLILAINKFNVNYKNIFLVNRTASKITNYISNNKHLFKVSVYNNNSADIIFNCTTLNINNAIDLFNIKPSNNSILFDLNYKYNYTNSSIITGLDMLVYQAKYNFFYWFGYYPNTKDIFKLLAGKK